MDFRSARGKGFSFPGYLPEIAELRHNHPDMLTPDLTNLASLFAGHPYLAFAALILYPVAAIVQAVCKVIQSWRDGPRPPRTGA